MIYKAWTKEEKDLLLANYTGDNLSEIALKLKRSKPSVSSKVRDLRAKPSEKATKYDLMLKESKKIGFKNVSQLIDYYGNPVRFRQSLKSLLK